MPTFPLEEMSQRAIEHAATSPSRFVNLFMKKDVRLPVHPFATRLLTSRSRGGRDDGALDSFRLVPGGRFLISCSVKGVIHLWDLGYTSEAMIKPFPIASMTSFGAQILTIQPTVDHVGIRMVLSSVGSEYVLSYVHSGDDANNIKAMKGSVSVFMRSIPHLSLLDSE